MERIEDLWRIDLLREVARGGMSVVYEGRLHGCDGFDKTVAVKMMLEKLGADARFARQFVAEAKLVSDLVHENIVQIHQLGRMPDGRYYFVMEFVQGLPLRYVLEHHRVRALRLPVPLAVHVASRIARGLAYAHGFHDDAGRPLGIVHRDVCPSNILVTTEGLAKLADFGIAKARALAVIGDDWFTGKIPYMSPEQSARQEVDFRSDQFSLAAVLFELLAGVPVRDAKSDPEKVPFALLPIPWAALPADVPYDVREVLQRALDPEPAARYAATADMATALEIAIYKDGYGPTIQTVEAYLRRHFSFLYRARVHPPAAEGGETVVAG